ncbi:hypothetical protein P3T23_003705 [Paraburkholderia sp. GAS448]|jgi:hypothetical protein
MSGTEAFPVIGPRNGPSQKRHFAVVRVQHAVQPAAKNAAYDWLNVARMLAASLTSNLPGASTFSVLTTPSSTTIA